MLYRGGNPEPEPPDDNPSDNKKRRGSRYGGWWGTAHWIMLASPGAQVYSSIAMLKVDK